MGNKVLKLFMNDRSQGDNVILAPQPKSWQSFFEQTPLPSEDFMEERVDLPPQERDQLF